MSRAHLRVAAAIMACSVVAGTATAGATATASAVRFAGSNRYATAQNNATSNYTHVTAPLLATGGEFADALASSYLAGATHSPILLTPTGSMDPGLPATLHALGSTGVEIIGGTAAVSAAAEKQINDAGFTTTRVAGTDRYDTARQIATLIPKEGVGQFESFGRTAVLVSGTSFPDALASGPMSDSQGWPILLTTADHLHPAAKSAIDQMQIKHVIIVGGTGVVSDQVNTELQADGVTTERIAGVDRSATALAVADFLFDRLSYDANDMILARGDTFADALTAGPRGGEAIEPILLTPGPSVLGPSASKFISDHTDVMTTIEVFGGTAAISQSVEDEAVSLAHGTG